MLIDAKVVFNGQLNIAGTVHHVSHHQSQSQQQQQPASISLQPTHPAQQQQQQQQHQQQQQQQQLFPSLHLQTNQTPSNEMAASGQILNTLLSSNNTGSNPFMNGSLATKTVNNTNPFLNTGNALECSPLSQELLAQNAPQQAQTQTVQTQFQHDKRKSSPQVISINEILESIQKPEHFPSSRHRWNTNEEIAGFLLALDRHDGWLSHDVKNR